MTDLTEQSITFGKYNGRTLYHVLRDRKYCKWLLKQDWFRDRYLYLYNQILESNPHDLFFPKEVKFDDYKYFHLPDPEEKKIQENLSEEDLVCYKYYYNMIEDFKVKIEVNKLLKNNPYDIKAPSKWLKKFEAETGLNRKKLKEFMNAYELDNVTTVLEEIKKLGGLEYKGARSFIIAKQRSLDQEKFWKDKLREKYGQDISAQYKKEKCLFDAIYINQNILYECKLGFKDFNVKQYNKYIKELPNYDIVYLFGTDCIVNITKGKIWTTKPGYYQDLLSSIKVPNELFNMLVKFDLIKVDNLDEYI